MKTYNVCHILVKAKYEAEDILKLMATGQTFEKLAERFSICNSAKNGGHLGELKFGTADEDFENAVKKLKVDEITIDPIRTKFGYHLIKRIK